MLALEQMTENGQQGEQSEDAFTQVVKSMDGAEDNIRRMQASGNLFEVSKNGIAAIESIVRSSMKEELKSKAFTILHVIQDNARSFERLAAANECMNMGIREVVNLQRTPLTEINGRERKIG